jgi:hypothetical protein
MVVMVNNEDDLRKGKMRMIFFFFRGGGNGSRVQGFFCVCRSCSTMADRGSNWLGKVCEGL